MPHAQEEHSRAYRGLSLRFRLTLWMIGVFMIMQMTLGALFLTYRQREFSSAHAEHVISRSHALADAIGQLIPGITDSDLTQLELAELASLYIEQIQLAVFHAEGDLLAAPSGNLDGFDPGRLLSLTAQDHDRLLDAHRFVREGSDAGWSDQKISIVGFTGVDNEPYLLVLATSDIVVQRSVRQVARALLFTAILGALAAAVAGWMVAGVAVAPIHQAKRAVEHFSATALDVATDRESDGAADDEFDFDDAGSEMYELKVELDDARQRLERAFRAQERFISNISHELKTPIAVLLTESDVLRPEDLPEDAKQFVVSVREEMRRLGKLVESFLMLSKLREGKPPVYSNRHPANELVMDAVMHCSKVAGNQLVKLDPSLLESDDEMGTLITGDHALLRTMLDNLIVNAIRFSPDGERVRILMERAGDEVLIRVRDHGPGIPEDKLEEIFDRFTRAHEERTQGRGYGLGLQIAQGIAELHGGEITAHNREGGGCEFVVSLPAAT